MMVQGVYSDDPQAQLEATTQFRKLLSIGRYTFFPFQKQFSVIGLYESYRHLMVACNMI